MNYHIRFRGPVTALTARRVRPWVGAGLICQPDPRPCIKTGLSPAAFSTALSIPFSPFILLHSPVVPQARRASPSPACPPVPTERYDAASEEKCLSATPSSDSLDTPAALSHCSSTCGSSLEIDDDGVPDFLGSPAMWPRDGVRCRTTAILLPASSTNQSYLPNSPHGRQSRVSTLTGCLATALSFADLHYSWCWSGRGTRNRRMLRCDDGNAENPACAARASSSRPPSFPLPIDTKWQL